METVRDFIFLDSKITAYGDCSHEIKRCLLLGRKAREHIKKQRHYFANKGPSSQGYSFSSGHAWCESWTIKKAEHWRIDAFELWCCRRLLRVPWTARRTNQSILKEISPEYSFERLMLKLKLQYFGHLMRRTHLKRPWCLEWLKAGGEGDDIGWDGWMVSLTQWIWVWVNSGSCDGQGSLACCSHGVAKSRTRLSDWTERTETHPGSLLHPSS